MQRAAVRLRRRLRVESTDGTVDIPEVADEALIATLRHGDGHRLEVSWSVGIPGASWREALQGARPAGDEPVGRALDAACRVARPHPTGRLLAPTGDRLEQDASLQGMAAVRLPADVLPQPEAVPGLVGAATAAPPG